MAKAQPVAGFDCDGPIFVSAGLSIGTRLNEMLAWEPYIFDPENVYELHQMRIAAKRLRYTLEIFQEIYAAHTRFGKPYGEAIEAIKGLQEHLGEIHDADVLVPQLTEHMARLIEDGYGTDKKGEPKVGVHRVDFAGCQGLLQVCQNIRVERDKQYDLLLQDWRELQSREFFTRLREILRAAVSETVLDAVLHTRPDTTAAKPKNNRAARQEPQHEVEQAREERAGEEDGQGHAPEPSGGENAPTRRTRRKPAS